MSFLSTVSFRYGSDLLMFEAMVGKMYFGRVWMTDFSVQRHRYFLFQDKIKFSNYKDQ